MVFVGFQQSVFDYLLGFLAISIALGILIQIGVTFSALVLRYKKVNSLFGVLDTLLRFIGGAYVPVQTFPFVLQILALLLPNTFGIDLLRVHFLHTTPILASYVKTTWLAISLEWLILLSEFLFFSFIARLCVRAGEKAGMKEGFYHL